MKIYLSILALVLVTGCSTSNIKEYRAPDGTAVKTVNCTSDSAKCFVSASESCPNGGTYRVVSSESHSGGLLADLIPGPITWYSMTYSCGASDGKMPDFKFSGQQYVPSPPQPIQPRPIIVQPRPITTTCTPNGNSVTCNSY